MNDPGKLTGINSLFRNYGTLKTCRTVAPQRYVLSVKSPYPFQQKGYFLPRGITFVLRKTGSGHWLELTKQALKKKLVFECSYGVTADGGTNMSLAVSQKFNAEEFAREAFQVDKDNQRVRIRMRTEF
jgi:hypothetical protein